jgi:hypothetical protein
MKEFGDTETSLGHDISGSTAMNMKTAVFWDAASCSLVDTDQPFRGAYCLHYQGQGCNIPEDSHLHL